MNQIMNNFDLECLDPDEDDWPQNDLGQHLCSLEKAFTCDICKGFLTNPHSLPCQHSFCCECVTRCFDSALNGKINGASHKECPICRKVCDPSQSKPNGSLAKAVQSFQGAKKDLLVAVHAAVDTAKINALNRNTIAPWDMESKDGGGGEAQNSRPVRKRKHSSRHDDRDWGFNEDSDNAGYDDNDNDEDFCQEVISTRSGGRRGGNEHPPSGSSSSHQRPRGAEITKKVNGHIFDKKLTTQKVKQLISGLADGCVDWRIRGRLQVDGNYDYLKRRYKDLVVAINSQIGVSGGLTLDDVLLQFIESEKQSRSGARVANQNAHVLKDMKGTDQGFKKLVEAENKKRRLAAAAQADVGDNVAVSSQTCKTDVYIANSNHGTVESTSSSPISDTGISAPSSSKKNHKRSSHDNASYSISAGIGSVDMSIVETEESGFVYNHWRIMFSEKINRYFYFDTIKQYER